MLFPVIIQAVLQRFYESRHVLLGGRKGGHEPAFKRAFVPNIKKVFGAKTLHRWTRYEAKHRVGVHRIAGFYTESRQIFFEFES